MAVGTSWPGEEEAGVGEGAQRNWGWGEVVAGDLVGRTWVGEEGEDGMREEEGGGRKEAGEEGVIGEVAEEEEGVVGRNVGEAEEALMVAAVGR